MGNGGTKRSAGRSSLPYERTVWEVGGEVECVCVCLIDAHTVKNQYERTAWKSTGGRSVCVCVCVCVQCVCVCAVCVSLCVCG